MQVVEHLLDFVDVVEDAKSSAPLFGLEGCLGLDLGCKGKVDVAWRQLEWPNRYLTKVGIAKSSVATIAAQQWYSLEWLHLKVFKSGKAR